jgi:rubrerythrin
MSNAKKPSDVGSNRTGISTAPALAKKAVEGAAAGSPPPDTDPTRIEVFRQSYSETAEPVGTMPPPGSIKGAIKAVAGKLKGKEPMVFIDLIGERLAFERTGTRLYDALVVKAQAGNPRPEGPDRIDLENIRDDELRHFALLKQALEQLGADPTVITPSADVCGVAAMGWVQAVSDPRTTLTEALKVALAAELADNDGWLVLADMAGRLGYDELAAAFREALIEEEHHLARVRSWVIHAVDGQAGLSPMPAPPPTEHPAV